jgi:hypothetical protein
MAHFPNLILTLKAEPPEIYKNVMPGSPHSVNPVKFTLTVENKSRSDYKGQALNNDPVHIVVSQDGKQIGHAPERTSSLVLPVEIPAASSRNFPPVEVFFHDPNIVSAGDAQAEANFTPNNDKISITLSVKVVQ